IGGIVAYYAPTDLAALAHVPRDRVVLDLRQLTRDFVGADADAEPTRFAGASPSTFAATPVPPTLLIHGARDEVVPVAQSRSLAARLTAAGNTVAYLELPWSAHDFDAAFYGLGSQLVLYEQDRFLAWAVAPTPQAWRWGHAWAGEHAPLPQAQLSPEAKSPLMRLW